jgi:hypothetical protein
MVMTSRVDFVKLAISANHSSQRLLAGEVECLRRGVHNGAHPIQ